MCVCVCRRYKKNVWEFIKWIAWKIHIMDCISAISIHAMDPFQLTLGWQKRKKASNFNDWCSSVIFCTVYDFFCCCRFCCCCCRHPFCYFVWWKSQKYSFHHFCDAISFLLLHRLQWWLLFVLIRIGIFVYILYGSSILEALAEMWQTSQQIRLE